MVKSVSRSKGLSLVDKMQPVLLIVSVFIGLGIHKFFPSYMAISALVVKVGIFIVITLIMSEKKLVDIVHALGRRQKLIGIALGINFVFIPVYGWLLGKLFLAIYPEIYAGYLLYLVTPCIGWYLVFTGLARGDTSTGIVLLGFNLLFQLALMPVYSYIFLRVLIPFDMRELIYNLAIYLVLPLLLSRVVRIARLAAMETSSIITALKIVLLMIVIASMFTSQAERLYMNPFVLFKIVPPITIFFLTMPLLNIVIAKAARMTYEELALLTFTTTARNSEVSLAIAATVFPQTLVPLVVAIAPALELPLLVTILFELMIIRNRLIAH